MCDWLCRGKTEVAKSNTALRQQGRHLSLKGGRSNAVYQHSPKPCNPASSALDCTTVLPFQVGQLQQASGASDRRKILMIISTTQAFRAPNLRKSIFVAIYPLSCCQNIR